MSEMASAHERGVVRRAARVHALDWYLAALLGPEDRRDDLVTIAAFLGEIGRIPHLASEPSLALIRLQWWREAIERGAVTGNPIADEMVRLARRMAMPHDLLLRPLDGRVRELDEAGVPDEAALETYLAETAGTPFRLATIVLGGILEGDLNRLCRVAGEAWGRLNLALDLPRHLSRGRLPLPPTRLGRADPRAQPYSSAQAALRYQSALLADEARLALREARALLGGVPRAAFAAFLPLALVEPYLRALESRRRDPLREPASLRPLTRVSRLWLAKWRVSL